MAGARRLHGEGGLGERGVLRTFSVLCVLPTRVVLSSLEPRGYPYNYKEIPLQLLSFRIPPPLRDVCIFARLCAGDRPFQWPGGGCPDGRGRGRGGVVIIEAYLCPPSPSSWPDCPRRCWWGGGSPAARPSPTPVAPCPTPISHPTPMNSCCAGSPWGTSPPQSAPSSARRFVVSIALFGHVIIPAQLSTSVCP